MNDILEQIYQHSLNKKEIFLKQIQFLINAFAMEQSTESKPYNIESKPYNAEGKSYNVENKSSHQLGQEGQEFILQLLRQLFKDVQDQSKTPHVGDILVNYLGHTIMFEVKNKQNITREDIIKFKEDLQNNKFDMGVFISLKTDHIQQIGSFDIIDNQVYLSKDFINLQSFTLLKAFIEKYIQKEQPKTDASQNQNPQNQNSQNQNPQIEIQKDLQIISAFKTDLSTLQSLFQEAQNKQLELQNIYQRIQAKVNIYNLSVSEYKDQQYAIQRQNLQIYLAQTPKNQLRKSALVSKYPALQLQQYNLSQIIETFAQNSSTTSGSDNSPSSASETKPSPESTNTF